MVDNSETKTYVLFHGPACFDGKAAALAFWLYFQDKATYIPVDYKRDMPKIQDGSIVYILDFSYPAKQLIELSKRVKELVILDHHKTAEAALKDISSQLQCKNYVKFDMNKSGAILAYEYINKKYGKLIKEKYDLWPEYKVFFKYIQDRDLWHWKMPYSKEVSAYIASHDNNFSTLFDIMQEAADRECLLDIITEGAAIVRYQKKQVEIACKSACIIDNWKGYRVALVNAANLVSEVGEYLLKENPSIHIAVMWHTDKYNHMLFSVRSRPDVDCSIFAEQFGGGGHAQASGFSIKKADREWIIKHSWLGRS